MASKFKFKVPSADEMSKPDSVVKPMSLFENFKKQKAVSIEGKVETSKQSAVKQSTTLTSVKASSEPKTVIQANQLKSSAVPSSSNVIAPESAPQVALSSSNTSEPSSVVSSEVKAPTNKVASSNSIIVNFRQRGNPILKHIRNVPWEYNNIIPDYVLGKATCALYLSLRYHQLNPTYIHNRLKELGKGYDLRVLLGHVDVKEPHHLLKDLAKICILADLTLVLAFSTEEAGRYLETYKVYENKPPDVLMEKIDKDYVSKLTDTLTSVKSVNKTDSMTLLSTFKTTDGIINASKEDLSLCAGFGPQKAQRLYDVFHEPFLKSRKRLPETSTESKGNAKKKTR